MDTTTLLSALKLVGTPLCLEAAKEIEHLTAAAQVGEPMKEIKQYEAMIARNVTQAQIEAAAKAIGDLELFEVYDCEKAAEAALTAAAQVGEQATCPHCGKELKSVSAPT